MYDPFFQHPRPYNKVLYKVLYSDEVVKNYGKLQNTLTSQVPDKQLTYDMKMPPSSYDQYKKMQGPSQMSKSRQIQSATNKERERNFNSGTQSNERTP